MYIRILIILLLLSIKTFCLAQEHCDAAGISALVQDDKNMRNLVVLRATLEHLNERYHEDTQDKTITYRNLEVDLDKYRKAFDYLALAMQTLQTAYTIYDVPKEIYGDISAYLKVLDRYEEKCLSRGNIVPEDTLFITYFRQASSSIKDDVNNIYKSVTSLAKYPAGAAIGGKYRLTCTTNDLTKMMKDINTSLRKIQKHVHLCYYNTYTYVQARTLYYKGVLWRDRDRKSICEEAAGRWKAAGGAYKFYSKSR